MMLPEMSWYKSDRSACKLTVFLIVLCWVSPIQGQRETDAIGPVPAYALLVGSNRPGPGQNPLLYTHDDAGRMKKLLVELGGYSPNNITLLQDPTTTQIQVALDDLTGEISAHAKQEEHSSFLFYYSGHARSDGLNLGSEQLALNTLRTRLQSIPATLKVVLLDACQAGAYSRVKGVESAADFSINSVSQLQTAGTAVIASSGASELSQESDTLRGSFFTHHLIVGLRGAADSNRDGRVTLFEAYSYAYNQTLLATAETAVGKQHVTLETDLTGKGEMILTWPAKASALLTLPKSLNGEVLIYQDKNRVVLAEIQKSSGSDLSLACAPGEYTVVLRRDRQLDRCTVELKERKHQRLNLNRCEEIDADNTWIKFSTSNQYDDGPATTSETDPFSWRFFVEAFFGAQIQLGDAYTKSLEQFEYRSTDVGGWIYYAAVLGLQVNRYLSFGLQYSVLDKQSWKYYGSYNPPMDQASEPRGMDYENVYYGQNWQAHRIAPVARVSWPLLDHQLLPYVQIGAGVAIADIDFEEALEGPSTTRDFTPIGYTLSGGLGVGYRFYTSLCMIIQAEYIYAPIIENQFEEKHDSGGLAFYTGLRFFI